MYTYIYTHLQLYTCLYHLKIVHMSLWQITADLWHEISMKKIYQYHPVSMCHDMVVPHMHHGMKCNHKLELR